MLDFVIEFTKPLCTTKPHFLSYIYCNIKYTPYGRHPSQTAYCRAYGSAKPLQLRVLHERHLFGVRFRVRQTARRACRFGETVSAVRSAHVSYQACGRRGEQIFPTGNSPIPNAFAGQHLFHRGDCRFRHSCT